MTDELITEDMLEEEVVFTKQRYFIHLAYDGGGFCGWQIQNNGDTVQAALNFALSKILNEHVASMGCGRTDTGVHATSFYAHFTTGKELPSRFADRLNSILPQTISIFSVIPVHPKAHTRFDAYSRTYEYFINFYKSPFLRSYSMHCYVNNLNWDAIHQATAMLTTFNDFTSLCRPSDDFKTNICGVTEARWDAVKKMSVAGPVEDEFMRFTITSNRFLRGMVRKTVGTLLMVGSGKISVEQFHDTVMHQKEFYKTALAPPNGLYLTDVKYPYPLDGNVHWVRPQQQ